MTSQAFRRGIVMTLAMIISFGQTSFAVRPGLTWRPSPPFPSSRENSLHKADPAASRRATESYCRLPLSFEANDGQFDAQVKFASHSAGYSLALTQTGAVFALRHGEASLDLRMGFAGATPHARIEGVDPLPGKSNYLVGSDQTKWRTGVAAYAKVRYREIYRGIDAVFYGDLSERGRQLEYDFIVAPGADPREIELSFDGAERMNIDRNGDLVLRTAGGEIRHHKPAIYQEVNGERKTVKGGFVIRNPRSAIRNRRVGFRIARYDRSLPLVIDPYVLYFATFLGGSSSDAGNAIAVDKDGSVYVAGSTFSTDFPGSKTVQVALKGKSDAFVAKINAKGTALLWTTYLGGSEIDSARRIAFDADGAIYLAGTTQSSDFPLLNPIQAAYAGGGDSFIAKLRADGAALLYSSYLGGKGFDNLSFAAVDPSGALIVAGTTGSNDFPTLNALQAENAASPVYRSDDGGRAWSRFGAGLPPAQVRQIAFDPKSSATFFAATEAGVYKSTNGGMNWIATGLGRKSYRLAIDPVTPTTLYAATVDPLVELFKSEDGGATWKSIHNGLGPVYIIDIVINPKTPTTLYLAAGRKVFRSTNGGDSWTGFDLGLDVEDYVNTLAIDPVSPNRVYAGGKFGIFRSLDGGVTWRLSSNGFKAVPVIEQLLFDPANPVVLYAAINKFDEYFQRINDAFLYKSLDGGENWVPADAVATGKFPGVLFELAIDPFSPETLYAIGSTGGVSELYKRPAGADRWQRIQGAELPGEAIFLSLDPRIAGRIYTGFGVTNLVDAFVTKINPSGTALIYSTYLGGVRAEGLDGMALDAAGDVYLMGFTLSTNFPTTPGAYRSKVENCSYAMIFVSKLMANGRSLAYSTYIGCGYGSELRVDASGNAYFVQSYSLLVKLNQAGSDLVYARQMNHTWYGLTGLSVSPSGRACVAGCIGLPPVNPIGSYTRFECRAVEYDEQSNETPNSCLAGGVTDARGNVYTLGDPNRYPFDSSPRGTTPGVFQPRPADFSDVYITRYALVPGVQPASAANYKPSVAPGSLAVLFGSGLARTSQAATTTPLPTELAGVRVGIVPAENTVTYAPLLFVSPTQINFQLPDAQTAKATIFVSLDGEPVAAAPIAPLAVAPGLFTANANGRGPAAAFALRVRADGSRRNEPVARFDPALRQFVTTPIDLGPEDDQVFLVLFGTGWRYRSLMGAVTVTIGGLAAPVTYAGAQPSLIGVDQINVQLPRSLAGKGEVDVVVTVDGKIANTANVNIK